MSNEGMASSLSFEPRAIIRSVPCGYRSRGARGQRVRPVCSAMRCVDGLAEVADVVQRLGRLDVETGLSRHVETFSGTHGFPVCAGEFVAAAAGNDFHAFGGVGIEGQFRG